MSSVCGRLDFKDTESHLLSSSASSPQNCSNGSKHISCIGSEDAQESDGDDSGYINQNVNEISKVKLINKPISKSSPLMSLNDEKEDKNLATSLQNMSSESVNVVTIIPAIKGSREKHGKSVEKLSVKWAEDVYDPPPSIVSHTRNKKQIQKKSKSKDNLKKSGKKGQKGSNSNSSSSRSRSKDKKQSSSSRSKHSHEKFDWTTQIMPIVVAAASS